MINLTSTARSNQCRTPERSGLCNKAGYSTTSSGYHRCRNCTYKFATTFYDVYFDGVLISPPPRSKLVFGDEQRYPGMETYRFCPILNGIDTEFLFSFTLIPYDWVWDGHYEMFIPPDGEEYEEKPYVEEQPVAPGWAW